MQRIVSNAGGEDKVAYGDCELKTNKNKTGSKTKNKNFFKLAICHLPHKRVSNTKTEYRKLPFTTVCKNAPLSGVNP
jgi:hypothetical protein